MLTTSQLHIDGRHHTLLPSTTVEARKAEVLLIQADGQERRTALALALTGRMRPSSGSVALGHDGTMTALRKRSAIVDSPEVNAPEHHLTVRSLVSEDLALVPLAFRDRTRPTAWLVKHGFRDILDHWVEALAPGRLLHLQLELTLANQYVDVVVVDSPDRHTADPSAWLPLLEQAAAGQLGRDPDSPADTPPRPLIVVGVVGRLPDGWTGPSAVAGNATAVPVVEPVETEPVETEPVTPPVVEPVETEPGFRQAQSPMVETEPGFRQAQSPLTATRQAQQRSGVVPQEPVEPEEPEDGGSRAAAPGNRSHGAGGQR